MGRLSRGPHYPSSARGTRPVAMLETTRDTLLNGELVLWQPAKGNGYRFNLDPIFLASFMTLTDTVIDLGAGCGVLGLFLLKTGRAKRLVAVERVSEMAALIKKNAVENGLEHRVEVLCGDLRELDLPRADTVVFNPPYFANNQGRPAKNELRDVARFERYGTLNDFVSTAASALVQGGEVAAIVPVSRCVQLCEAMESAGVGVARIRDVRPRLGEPARLSMIAGKLGEMSERQEEEALVIHDEAEGRSFSDEVNALVDGSAKA